jgi:hypothetical protein
MKSYVRTALIAAGLSALTLTAACHSSAPEGPVENTEVNLAEPVNEVIETNIVDTTATPVVTNATPAAPKTADDLSTDAQTLDDADATGMTAKLPEDNTTQPAH